MIFDEILASFIIPIFNAEKYLERCLNSVVAIRNDSIEIIIVDDGSTDMSSLIYERYAKEDNRIRIIKKENGGVSSARNIGILKANGEWVAFIDADDEIIATVYDELLLKLNMASELWMLGATLCYLKYPNLKRRVIEGIWTGEDIEIIKKGIFHQDMKRIKKLRNQGLYLKSPCAKFYLKRIIIENSIFFPENLTIGEDCLFNFIYLNYVKKISYINKCAYYYWQNDKSAMHGFNKGERYMNTAEHVMNFFEEDYLLEVAQYGVRCYLYAMKSDWCNSLNEDSYFIRKKKALEWRETLFIEKAFKSLKLSQVRWEAIPIAYCAKIKCFFLCDLLFKMKKELPVRFK